MKIALMSAALVLSVPALAGSPALDALRVTAGVKDLPAVAAPEPKCAAAVQEPVSSVAVALVAAVFGSGDRPDEDSHGPRMSAVSLTVDPLSYVSVDLARDAFDRTEPRELRVRRDIPVLRLGVDKRGKEVWAHETLDIRATAGGAVFSARRIAPAPACAICRSERFYTAEPGGEETEVTISFASTPLSESETRSELEKALAAVRVKIGR